MATTQCGNCEAIWDERELEDIVDYWERVEAGGEVPAGQCPDKECGSLCYLRKASELPAEPDPLAVDYTGKIGFLTDKDAEWPMFSFNKPSYAFWNGFANQLRSRGLNDEQIKEALQSKDMRHMFDADDNYAEIEQFGRQYAEKHYPLQVPFS